MIARRLFHADLSVLATGLLLALIAGCGARNALPAPDGAGGAGGAESGERVCLPECAVGHQCCIGGCGGPAAVTETDCCECLDGEVNSMMCTNGVCGGQ